MAIDEDPKSKAAHARSRRSALERPAPVSEEITRLIEKARDLEHKARLFSEPVGPLGTLFGVRTSSS